MQKNSLTHCGRALLGSLALAGALSACMSPAANLHRNTDDWQSAEFVERLTDQAVDVPLVSDCRKQVEGSKKEIGQFALIRQRDHQGKFVQTLRYRVVAIDAQEPHQNGEWVYFAPNSCQVPLLFAHGGTQSQH